MKIIIITLVASFIIGVIYASILIYHKYKYVCPVCGYSTDNYVHYINHNCAEVK